MSEVPLHLILLATKGRLVLEVFCGDLGLCFQFYHYRFYQLGGDNDLTVSCR